MTDPFDHLAADVIRCERCPRLRNWCEHVAQIKVRRFQHEDYWGRPLPGFGDPKARLWIVGLAPAAHGGSRTGRIFTGDRSGDFLFAALHRAGFANRPESVRRGDGLELRDCYISAVARCAPPLNRPTPEEIGNCREYLQREWQMLSRLQAIVALGQIAFQGVLALAREMGKVPPRVAFKFGHGVTHVIEPGLTLLGCYHPSQQNTFTGRLTPASLDDVLRRAQAHFDTTH